MYTLLKILDLHRGQIKRQKFLREIYKVETSHFYEANIAARKPSQTLLLAMQRYHRNHFPTLPLRLELAISGVKMVVDLHTVPSKPTVPRRWPDHAETAEYALPEWVRKREGAHPNEDGIRTHTHSQRLLQLWGKTQLKEI